MLHLISVNASGQCQLQSGRAHCRLKEVAAGEAAGAARPSAGPEAQHRQTLSTLLTAACSLKKGCTGGTLTETHTHTAGRMTRDNHDFFVYQQQHQAEGRAAERRRSDEDGCKKQAAVEARLSPPSHLASAANHAKNTPVHTHSLENVLRACLREESAEFLTVYLCEWKRHQCRANTMTSFVGEQKSLNLGNTTKDPAAASSSSKHMTQHLPLGNKQGALAGC